MIKLRDANGNVLGSISDSGEMNFSDEVIRKEFEQAEKEQNEKK